MVEQTSKQGENNINISTVRNTNAQNINRYIAGRGGFHFKPNIVKYGDSNVNAYNNHTANVYADTNTPPQQLGETMVLP